MKFKTIERLSKFNVLNREELLLIKSGTAPDCEEGFIRISGFNCEPIPEGPVQIGPIICPIAPNDPN